MIDFNTRCPPLEGVEPSLKAGDINDMFERIVATGHAREEGAVPLYAVTVHSRPLLAPRSVAQPTMFKNRGDLEQAPWVITFDQFLTDEECEHLIQLGYKNGYKRSEDVGELQFDGSYDGVKSHSRTSENAWCSLKNGCRSDPVVVGIMNRMSTVLGIPLENLENLQMLKYEEGQFYGQHHNYNPEQRNRQCGPRILTFFLYLNDVEEGGGTRFPELNPPLTISPKRGRALLWPSVLNSNPMNSDLRMDHEALPVITGTKFGTNAW